MWIRYLIRYFLTNLYRIWIPPYNKVIITKDVYFNKEEVFNSSTEIFKCDVKNMFLEYLVKIVKKATRTVTIIILLIIYNDTVEDLKWFYKSEGNKREI